MTREYKTDEEKRAEQKEKTIKYLEGLLESVKADQLIVDSVERNNFYNESVSYGTKPSKLKLAGYSLTFNVNKV